MDANDIGLSMAFVSAMSAIVQGGLLRVVIPKFGPAHCAYFGVSATIVAFIGVATASNSAAYFGVAFPLWECLLALRSTASCPIR